MVPLSQLAGVVGQDDHPFLLGGHYAGRCGESACREERSDSGSQQVGHVLRFWREAQDRGKQFKVGWEVAMSAIDGRRRALAGGAAGNLIDEPSWGR